jgi:BirA family biotin operon repressor/biotin-[acetyl-CoA-carboxylase] ligase
MSGAVAFSEWQPRLERACAATTMFRVAHALAETPSTQDAPETRGAAAGTVVAAWRQTAGRGRFGRQWIEQSTAGVAVTFVIDAQRVERLALASAVAAAEACETALGARVGIKWPNDIVVAGRKLAGVLVETRGDRAFVGVGINVAHERFEGELESRATSMAILGARVDRLTVLEALVAALDRAVPAPDSALVDAFLSRDALRGTKALFATPEGPVEGEVRSVDPMHGLVVRTDSGERFLPAHSTSVAEWGGRVVRPAAP